MGEGEINGTHIATGSISDTHITGTISNAKLATISTAGKVANSATTATASSGANTIVLRDDAGAFEADQITASQIVASGNLTAGEVTTGLVTLDGSGSPADIRAAGGVNLYTNADFTVGVFLSSGSGTWDQLSDRRRKSNFADEDAERVLLGLMSIPIQSWNYDAQSPTIRHLGPTAQDFRAAFHLGVSDTTISTVDADGVSMLAIQALGARTDALRADLASTQDLLRELEAARVGLGAAEARYRTLLAENAELRAAQERLEKRLAVIEAALAVRR